MTYIDNIFTDKNNFENFLNKKGFKFNDDYRDSDYPEARFYELGQHRLLAIQESTSNDEIKIIKEHFLIEKGLTHCAILLENKLIFFRNYGERKHFIFSQKNKNNISKRDKLDKIDKDIDILFQTKDISKSFYNAFKQKRDLLVQRIEGKLDPYKKFLISQKIFDRIFFIYFLCHKGIVRFDNNERVEGKTLFKILNENEAFYSNLLELFKAFNAEKRELKIADYKFFIPYLNGGIFRIDEDEGRISINLTKKEWNGILEFLNGYHWIIEDDVSLIEDETDEKILTPEILGHIYERSVVEWELKGFKNQVEESAGIQSERKKKGVYYTQEDITEFICHNSLNQSLAAKLKVNASEIPVILDHTTKNQYTNLLAALDTIRIIDPACGSGAFLVKMADILFRMKVKILSELKQKAKFYDVKKDIIVNNIFGVDILQGAAEIAKLRLWLWLVSSYSEEKEIQPLPNIEYNIIVGNSLVGWDDEKLSITFDNPYTEATQLALLGLKIHAKKTIKKIYEQVETLLQTNNFDNYIHAYSLLHDTYKNSHGEEAEQLKIILTAIKKYIYQTINQSLVYKVNEYVPKKKKIGIDRFVKLFPFHWRFDFGDIMREGGFDIVIGNPPYGNILDDTEKWIVQRLYPYNIISSDEDGKGTNNSSAIFLERAFKILKEDGILGFIVPSSIARVQEFTKLRNFLRNYSFKKISEVGKAFDEVGLEMIILIMQKSSQHEKSIILSHYDGKFHDKPIDYSIYDSRDIFLTMIDMEKYKIIETIEKNSIELGTIGEMPRGFTLSASEFQTNPSKNSILVLGGANIFRFGLKDGPTRKPNRFLPMDFEPVKNKYFTKNRIVYQNVASSVPRIIAALEYSKKPTDDTINNLILSNEKLLKPILLILNSNLTTFYLKYAIINCSKLTVHLDKPYVGKLRIKEKNNMENLEKFSDYLSLLNAQFYNITKKNKDVADIANMISFFNKIGNYLVYELFLQEMLESKVSKFLQDLPEINCEKFINKSDKNKIDFSIPENIMEQITAIYYKLRNDKKFENEIENISKNSWIEIFEKENSELKIN